jgi:hypothetical protein
MKTGLPLQHMPDPMEAKHLHLLCRLYGEVPPNGLDPESDPELAAEWRAWQEVKAWLDARPRPRPDPAIVDRVVAAAAQAARAADRLARARQRPWYARKTMAAGLTVLAVLVGIGVYGLRPVPTARTGQIRAEQVATTPQAIELAMVELVRSATPSVALVATKPPTAQAPLSLEWDDREAVQQVYRQLQLLEARSAPDAWEPALPLEAWPTRQATPGLLPASRRMP